MLIFANKSITPVMQHLRRISASAGAFVIALNMSLSAHAASDSWSAAGQLDAIHAFPNTIVSLTSGKVLLTTGYGAYDNGNGLSNAAALYNPTNNTWSAAANLVGERYRHTTTLLASGKVLMTGGGALYQLPPGGSTEAGWYKSWQFADIYDPASDTWNAAANLGTARYYHTATLLQSGKVLVVDGWGGAGPLASAELYDPKTNMWAYAASPQIHRYVHTATLLTSGKVLIVGGTDAAGGALAAEIYDPSNDTWSSAGSPAAPRIYHTATMLLSGKVLVVGDTTLGAPSSTELYDPASNTWSHAARLNIARQRHSATLLLDGKVLVAGGLVAGATTTSSIPTASAELYDPASDTWSPAASLGTARYKHVATLLPSGQAVIAGGIDNGNALLANAERFEPQAVAAGAPTILPTLSPAWLALLTIIVGGIGAATQLRLRHTQL